MRTTIKAGTVLPGRAYRLKDDLIVEIDRAHASDGFVAVAPPECRGMFHGSGATVTLAIDDLLNGLAWSAQHGPKWGRRHRMTRFALDHAERIDDADVAIE